MDETERVLSRFYGALVEEIRVQRPDYLTGPFTVAEIYQNLVPYGQHRDRIGVEMNGDYEDALLRLLAGEGGYLILESDTALQNLREELESPNPNTGMYREYAAVDVRLDAKKLNDFAVDSPGVAGGDVTSHEPEDAIDMDLLNGSEGEPAEDAQGPASEGDGDAQSDEQSESGGEARSSGEPESDDPLESESERESTSESDGEGHGACRWCRADLPRKGPLNFCPFCGTDVNIVPCGQCGEELEPEWRFCAACGAEAQP